MKNKALTASLLAATMLAIAVSAPVYASPMVRVTCQNYGPTTIPAYADA